MTSATLWSPVPAAGSASSISCCNWDPTASYASERTAARTECESVDFHWGTDVLNAPSRPWTRKDRSPSDYSHADPACPSKWGPRTRPPEVCRSRSVPDAASAANSQGRANYPARSLIFCYLRREWFNRLLGIVPLGTFDVDSTDVDLYGIVYIFFFYMGGWSLSRNLFPLSRYMLRQVLRGLINGIKLLSFTSVA